MNCCPSADIVLLDNGLRVSEKQIQADGYTLQFFPYGGIQTIRYTYTRGERGGTLSIWLKSGLSYRYCFPCGESGKEKFEEILLRLT